MSWSPWKNYDLVAAAGRPVVNAGVQTFKGAPTAVARSEDFVNVYVRGMDDRLAQYQWRRREGWSWAARQNDGGILASSPSAASRNGDQEWLAIRGTDDKLWIKEWNRASGWGNWEPKGSGGTFLDAPAAISRNNDVMNVYARGADNRVMQIFSDRGSWQSEWQVHQDGGLITSAPAAASLNDDHEALFARGTDRRLWFKEWNRGSGWTRWAPLGGGTTIQDGPVVASRNGDTMTVYARADDDAVLQLTFTRSSGWPVAWERHVDGGRVRAGLGVARLSDRSEMLFCHGTDARLWSKWWHDEGILTMPWHLKYVQDPSLFSFTTDEVIAATQLVFGAALVWAPAESVERINDITLLNINSGACDDWGLFTTFNSGQQRLYANRNNAGPDDLVIYFVNMASGWAGCAVHPDDRPGALVTTLAGPWVTAHEIGHVLGRGHEPATDHVMFRSDNFTALPPNLGSDQIGAGRHIRRR